ARLDTPEAWRTRSYVWDQVYYHMLEAGAPLDIRALMRRSREHFETNHPQAQAIALEAIEAMIRWASQSPRRVDWSNIINLDRERYTRLSGEWSAKNWGKDDKIPF